MLYKRRFTLFLVSFLLMLFGDIFVSPEWYTETQTVLILQNMLVSLLLFQQSSKLKKITIISLIVLAIASRISPLINPDISPYFFSVSLFALFFYCKLPVIQRFTHSERTGDRNLISCLQWFYSDWNFFEPHFYINGFFRGIQGSRRTNLQFRLSLLQLCNSVNHWIWGHRTRHGNIKKGHYAVWSDWTLLYRFRCWNCDR